MIALAAVELRFDLGDLVCGEFCEVGSFRGILAVAAKVGTTGDEGIDGIIKEDPLGLDIIYLQAKRWEWTVGRPEIQKFAGALQGQRARKGIFITTSQRKRRAECPAFLRTEVGALRRCQF